VRSKPGTVCVRTGTHTTLGTKIIYRYEQSLLRLRRCAQGLLKRQSKARESLGCAAASAERGMSEFAALRRWLEALLTGKQREDLATAAARDNHEGRARW